MAVAKRKKRKIRYSDAKKAASSMGKGGFAPTAFKIPNGMKLFQFEEKPRKYRIDIMPFIVGKGNPADVEEGEAHFERTYFTHQRVGGGDTFTCNRMTFGAKNKCAACKFRAKLASTPEDDQTEAEKKLIKDLAPKKRQLWIWRDLDRKEDGYQIAETAYYKSFGQKVKDEMDAADDDGPANRFWKLQGGATAIIKTAKDNYEGRKFIAVADVTFEDRKKDYKDSVIDDMPCLDDLIVPADQEALKEALTGGEDEDMSKDEKERKKKKAKQNRKAKKRDDDEDEDEDEEDTDDDDDDDDDDDEDEGDDDDDDDDEPDFSKGDEVSHKKYGDCKVVKVNKDGDVVTLKDEDGELHKGVKASACKPVDDDEDEDEDDDDDDDDEEDEKPKKKKAKKKSSKKDEDDDEEEEDDDDNDDDEDEEDEKPKKGKAKKAKAKKGKKSKKDDDDDDDDDVPFSEDDDDDDDD